MDRVVSRLASRQKGLVTYRALLAAGLTRHHVEWRVRTGRLIRVHRGVYLVGHTALAPGATELAAFLAYGVDTRITHVAAANVWSLHHHDGPIHITHPKQRRGQEGIVVHRGRIERPDWTRRNGIPVTSPARTLIDCASLLDPSTLQRALNEAELRRLTSHRALEAALKRAGPRRGTTGLRHLLGEPEITRSEAERRMLALLREANLPPSRVNVRRHGRERDFVYDEERIVIEVDGWAFHRTRAAFEEDRRRDQLLAARGWLSLRFTWRQIVHEAIASIASIAQALAERRRGPS